MDLAGKIYKLRKEHHISQEELAAQINISRQAVSKWESGQAMPDTNNIVLLSRILNVSTDYLLHDDMLPSPLIRQNPKKSRLIMIGAVACIVGFLGTSMITFMILLNSSVATQNAETATVSFHINGYFITAILSSLVLAVGAAFLLIIHYRK